jgi:hypothetical protein
MPVGVAHPAERDGGLRRQVELARERVEVRHRERDTIAARQGRTVDGGDDGLNGGLGAHLMAARTAAMRASSAATSAAGRPASTPLRQVSLPLVPGACTFDFGPYGV